MKKSVNPMDELFKDTFQTASDSIDQEALWPYVAQNLPKKEPNRFLLFFLSLALSLLFLLAAWFWAGNASTETDPLPKKQKVSVDERITIDKSTVIPTKPKETTARTASAGAGLYEGSASQESAMGSFLYEEKRQLAKDRSEEEKYQKEQYSKDLSAISLLGNNNNIKLLSSGERAFKLPLVSDPSWSRCSDKRFSWPNFFIEAYTFGGYPLLSTSINPNQAFDFQGYLQSWEQSETAVSAFSAGLLIGVQAKWGGSISSGFEYQQIQNRLNQEQRIIERITVYDEMAYFFLDSNNNRVYVADSVTTSRTYTRELQTAKTHTLLNIPVLLGYHRQRGNFRFGLIAGVNFHLKNEYKGKVLDASGQIINADTGTPTEVYRKNLSASIVGGLDAGYMFKQGWEVYVSPRFRYQSDSWLLSNHPLQSKIQLIGLQAGIRLHL